MKAENDCAISYQFIANITFSFVLTEKQYFSTYMQLYLVEKELQPGFYLPSVACFIDIVTFNNCVSMLAYSANGLIKLYGVSSKQFTS
jgi:hypothetical protein